MIPVIVKLAPKNTPCRPAYPMTPRYVTIHETGNTSKNSGAMSHANFLQGGGKNREVSWHYVVDDKNIIQCLPDNENAWHCGDGRNGIGNRQSLAIEICINPESDLYTAVDNAITLTANLMKKYNIPIENLKQHFDWSAKNCPMNIRKGKPITWGQFRDRVKERMTPPQEKKIMYRVQVGAFADKQNAVNYVKELKNKGISAFIIESEV